LISGRNQWRRIHPSPELIALDGRAAMIAQGREAIAPNDDRAEHWAMA
jgi:hypothetical protein